MTDLIARLRLEATAGNLPAVAGQTRNAVDGVRDAVQRTGPAMASAEAGANRLAGGLDRAGDQAQRFETRMGGAGRSVSLLNSLLGGAALGAFANDISKAAFAAGGLEMGLGAVTGGAAQAKGELAFVRDEAGRLGLIAQTTAKDFMDLAAATNETKLAGRDTREIWLATAEAGMALGRTPEQVGRGLGALQQIASKHIVSMEEIRQQLAEAIPGAVQIASRAMGMGSAAFNELVESGKLTADVFLPKFAAQLRSEYGPAIENYLTTPLGMARQEIGKTGTSLNDLRAATGEGFLEGVTSGLASLNAELGDGETAANAREIGMALGEGAAMAAEVVAFLVDHVDDLQMAMTAAAGVGLVRMLVSTAQAAQQATAAYLAKGGAARASTLMAQQGLAAEAAALGGVRGAIIQAAAAEVAAAQAVRSGAVARELAAKAAHDQARADLANIASSSTLAQRRAALAVAEAELAAARNASAAAAGRVAVAEAGHARSLTVMGQAASLAKGGMGALLAMVGGPWGAAFLAAAAAVMWTTNAIQAQEKKFNDVNKAVAETKAEYDALRAAQQAVAGTGVQVISAQDQAAVAAASLTGEVDKLADAHWRAAAAAKAQILEILRLKALEAGDQAASAVENFNTRRQGLRGQAYVAMAGGGRAAAPGQVAGLYESADAKAIKTEEFATMVAGGENARIALQTYQTEQARDLSNYRPETSTASGGGTKDKNKGKTPRDRVGDLRDDLRLEEAALKSHAEAALAGERALDAWRIADAGAQAVARAGLKETDAAAKAIRDQAEAVEKLAIADERIEQAAAFARSAQVDTEALKRRATAAAGGRTALEQLRVTEAGLDVLRQARVDSLDQLEGLERQAVQTALDAATAREREAIATEKAEAAGKSIEDMDREIAAEGRRQAAIGRGIEAETAYVRAEFIRQEVERAGLELTDDAARAIIEKADALFRLQAISDGSQMAADAERELRMMRLSNREREIAVRAETFLAQLAATRLDLTEQERAALADRAARADLEAEETAAAIGRITTSLRDGFVKDGKLGMEQIGDYAEERLRAAVYDAFLAKPIDILVNASVNIVNDLAKQFLSSAMGQGGLGGMLGGSGALAQMIPGIGQAVAVAAISSGLSGQIAAAMGGNSEKASKWGILGMVPGLIAGLGDKADRPYARADVEVRDGKFVLAGSQAADGGDKEGIAAAGKALADQLNALAKTFGLDLTKVAGLYTTLGKTQGGNAKALGGDGFFGGAVNGLGGLAGAGDIKGWTLGAGVKFSQGQDAEEITEKIIHDTILRAINAGASDLSEAERRFVAAAESLDEAVAFIETSRGFAASLDDMLLELLDPAEFERKKALAAVEATYQSLKAEAEKMIGAGLVSADVLQKIEQLRKLQMDAALNGLNGAAANPFADATSRLQSWLDGLAVSDLAPGGPREQRSAAKEQYDRVLAQAKAGDSDALAELATYADRLLRADRQATGSAIERQKLYDLVTGDVKALIGQISLGEALTPSAISGPIIAALAKSDTALSDILMTLPPEMAAPLLAAILREPDWAGMLLGENAQVPPELRALRDKVMAVAPEAAGPIVAAVLATPNWTAAMNAHLAAVPVSIETVKAALAGLPVGIAGPILGALAQTQNWEQAAVEYLKSVPPSLDLLAAVLAGQPPEVSGPIVDAILRDPVWAGSMLDQLTALGADLPATAAPILAALLRTPEWGTATAAYLQTLPPSLDLLGRLLDGQPAAITNPIVDAILRDPTWAGAMLSQLGKLGGDLPTIAAPIIAALLQTPEWGAATVAYLQGLPPSMDRLSAMLAGQPSAISGPIIAALLQTPGWGQTAISYLSGVTPSIELLAEILDGQPREITDPIVAALLQTPGWATAMVNYLAGLGIGGGAGGGAIGGGLSNAILGPLSELAGLQTNGHGGGSRPYTRADIVAQNGQWSVAGVDAADGGSRAIANQLGAAITESLNAASALFGINVSQLEGLYTTAGYVTGKNFKALGGAGYFGGDIKGGVDYYDQAGSDKKGNTVGSGVSFSKVGSAEAMAQQVVWETIQRAIAAGASGLSSAQASQVSAARSLEEALAALTKTGAVIQAPVVSPGAGGAVTGGTTKAIENLTKSFETRFSDLQASLDRALNDLADATAGGFEALAGVSVQQLDALKDTASAQRVANAHMIARQA
ncbi:hypothetical protein D3C71_314410 [compost metagenome]